MERLHDRSYFIESEGIDCEDKKKINRTFHFIKTSKPVTNPAKTENDWRSALEMAGRVVAENDVDTTVVGSAAGTVVGTAVVGNDVGTVVVGKGVGTGVVVVGTGVVAVAATTVVVGTAVVDVVTRNVVGTDVVTAVVGDALAVVTGVVGVREHDCPIRNDARIVQLQVCNDGLQNAISNGPR